MGGFPKDNVKVPPAILICNKVILKRNYLTYVKKNQTNKQTQ